MLIIRQNIELNYSHQKVNQVKIITIFGEIYINHMSLNFLQWPFPAFMLKKKKKKLFFSQRESNYFI